MLDKNEEKNNFTYNVIINFTRMRDFPDVLTKTFTYSQIASIFYEKNYGGVKKIFCRSHPLDVHF